MNRVCWAVFWLAVATAPGVWAAPVGPSFDGTRGYGLLTEASPEKDIAARVSWGIDMARSDGLLYEGDASRNTRTTAAISVSPWRMLEFTAQLRALDTYNAYVRPRVLRVRGDGLYSLKIGERWADFSVGGLLQARNYAHADTTAFASYLLASYEPQPWRIDAQLGWIGERHVVVGAQPSPAELFAWQKPLLNAASMRLGAGYDFAGWRAFTVLSGEAYIGEQTPLVRQPKRLTMGAHWLPGIAGFVVSPSADVRLGRAEIAAFPAEPPWRAGLLMSYQPPLREIVNRLFPPPGRFTGVVTDSSLGYAVRDARAFLNGREVPIDADGVFHFESVPGHFILSLDAPGYLPVTAPVRIEPAQVKLEKYGLRRNTGAVRGIVFLGEAKTGQAEIAITNPELRFQSDAATGAFSFELPPDAYAMTVSAPGFYPERRTFVVKLGKEVVYDRLLLRPVPVRAIPGPPAPTPVSAPALPAATAVAPVAPPAPVEIEEVTRRKRVRIVEEDEERERQQWIASQGVPLRDRIESPVFFAFGSWVIDPRAYPALDRLAELILQDTGIARIVIEGRADVIGKVEANRYVAGKRADAVFAYLAKRGISPGKMATTTTVYRKQAVGQSDLQRAQDRRVGFRVEREDE